jgi:type III secretion protein T
METAAADLVLERFGHGLSALVLGSMRVLGIAFVFPLFTWTRLTGPIRLVFAFAVSLPVSAMVHADLGRAGELAPATLAVLIGKEFMLGAAIGMVLAIPFWGAQAAGDVVDLYRGASAANLHDPMNATEVSVLGTLLIQLTLALFVVSGGLTTTLGAVFDTFRAWPVTQIAPPFTLDAVAAAGSLVGALVRVGVTIAGPLLLAMLLADVALVLIARGARQFPVFDLSVTAKNLVLIVLAPIYALFFGSYMAGEWGTATRLLRGLMGLP